MKDKKKTSGKSLVILITLAALLVVGAIAAGILAYGKFVKGTLGNPYGYVNPDETKAQADEGITIDGVLDEQVYQDNNWLYLHNANGESTVDIAMTSYYGEKGMYFVYDVTESTPIYVNLERNNTINSGVEMYLALSSATDMNSSAIFEIDLHPTGDIVFKQRSGKGSFVNVRSTKEIMAYLGTTTKGGEVNTEDCYGYNLEFFIPWEYLEWLGMDTETMKTDFVYVNPAHITSYNYSGTQASVDRYWYSFAKQLGGNGFGNVFLYYRFDEHGALDTVPVNLVTGEHYSITGAKAVVSGMRAHVTLTPEEGYAFSSILVNGEEYIGKVSYNEDGSVNLYERVKEKEVTISAVAEKVTDGNKTLKGTVKVNKVDGDTLTDVEASYKGPKGEKPITLDANGEFVLPDLQQGYYTITVEKAGYQKLVRSILLNRDMETELTLEYDMFEIVGGNFWDLETQNDGVLQLNRKPGYGDAVLKNTYNDFTIEANFKYNTDTAERIDTTNAQEQRQGIRIKFSNDKYLQVTLLCQKDRFFVQYCKSYGDKSLYPFKGAYNLTEEQVAKFKSDEGISLKVMRSGQNVMVYVDDVPVDAKVLGDEFKKASAEIAIETWSVNLDISEIPYSFAQKSDFDLNKYVFEGGAGFDFEKQVNGILVMPNGGRGMVASLKKYTDIDFTVRAKDDQSDDTKGRTSIEFTFENGETFNPSIGEGGLFQIKACTVTGNKWTMPYVLTKDEKAAYISSEGIDFRIVRNGTVFTAYITDVTDTTQMKEIWTADYSEYINADTKATVSVSHDDDTGIKIVMPFKITSKLERVVIDAKDHTGDALVLSKNTCIKGDVVVVTAKEGYYCTEMKVNGKKVTLNQDGTFQFTATEDKYTLKATVKKCVFKTNNKWNLLKQNLDTKDGVTTGEISLVANKYDKLEFYNKYTDMDLTLRVKDDPSDSTQGRTSVEFTFENGETFNPSIGAGGLLQIKASTVTGNKWATPYALTKDEKTAYTSSEGIDFRIVRNGTVFTAYITDVTDTTQMKELWTADYSEYINADTKATVTITHDDDKGIEIVMPFKVTSKLERVIIDAKDHTGDALVLSKNTCIKGDIVVVTAKEGYYCTEMKVNGKNVTLNQDGTFRFTATEDKYTIEATVKKSVFKTNNKWNLLKQNLDTEDGVTTGEISLVANKQDKLEFYNKYTDMDLTLSVKDDPSDSTQGRTSVEFTFDNGETFNPSIGAGGLLQIKACTVTGNKWATPYAFTNDEKAAYTSSEGIDFRIVRNGTVFTAYITDVKDTTQMKELWTADYSEYINADTKATVTITHDDDTGLEIVMPFKVTSKLERVIIDAKDHTGAALVLPKNAYIKGDVVVVSAKEGYYCTEMKVNEKNVTLNKDGTFQFTATEDNYTVEATVKKCVFKSNDKWNLLKQNLGTTDGITIGEISLVANKQDKLEFYNKYTGMDLTLRVKDDPSDSTQGRTSVEFTFENGETFNPSIGAGGLLQIKACTVTGNKWATPYAFTSDEKAAYTSAEGIDFRIVRDGTIFTVYIADVTDTTQMKKLWTADYSDYINADTKATVTITHDDDKGMNLVIPFIVTDEVRRTQINCTESDYGSIETQNEYKYIGDEIVISEKELTDSNYYLAGLKIDGKEVELALDGTYRFVATKSKHTVEGIYKKAIFDSNVNANVSLVQQNQGTEDGVTTGTVWVLDGNYSKQIHMKEKYTDIDLTVKVKDDPIINDSSKDHRRSIRLAFDNGLVIVTSVHKNTSNKLVIQNVGSGEGNTYDTAYTAHYIGGEKDADWVAYHTTEGIDFRVVRQGTDLMFYLNGTLRKTLDLSTRIDANTKVTASIIHHNGEAGTQVAIPYEVANTRRTSQIQFVASDIGSLKAEKNLYYLADTVVIKENKLNDANYYLAGLKIDGKEVELAPDGTYRFTATKSKHKVEGIYKKAIFDSNVNANVSLVHQNQGTEDGVTTGTIWVLDGNYSKQIHMKEKYTDIDLTIKVKDDPIINDSSKDHRRSIRLAFDNGLVIVTSVHQNSSNKLVIQNVGSGEGNTYDTAYTAHYIGGEKDADWVAYHTTEGIDFRVVRQGTNLMFYLNGTLRKTLDLSAHINANTKVKASIIHHNGESGTQVAIPYTLRVDNSNLNSVQLLMMNIKNAIFPQKVSLQDDSRRKQG